MFTGIIKAIGTVQKLEQRGGDVRLSVASAHLDWSRFEIGESIAVSGVCLTAVNLEAGSFDADVSMETLNVTGLGKLSVGSAVNLEPSLRAGESLGGHLVSGHVDCVGTVTNLASDARSVRLTIEIPEAFARYVPKKGSICVDGVSLTINEVSGNRFNLNIIPHTASVTTIGGYSVGTIVNIEVDQIARYLERLLVGDESRVTLDLLRAHGYA